MMRNALLALVLALSPLAYAQDNDTNVVLQDLNNAKIIPDVVPPFTPKFPLEVVFTDASDSTFAVSAGSRLTINQTAKVPTFALKSTDTQIIGQPYLIAIVDPDAPNPSDPTLAEFRHFLAADYVSSGLTNGQFPLTNHSSNKTLTEYTPPELPESSTAHRYAVLCYLQSKLGVTPPDGFHSADRLHFNITEFVNNVQGNNLTLVAATFFYVSANDTTGSVAPNSTTGSSTQAAAKPSGAFKHSTTAAWSFVTVLSITGYLLL